MKYGILLMGAYDITDPGYWRTSRKARALLKGGLVMAGFVQGIFFALEGGAEMKSVQAATALEGCGLEGDRYCAGTGHWSRFGRVCEVTFIAGEDLDYIERETGVSVRNGEHRRNIVTRRISLKALRRGERFRVGEAMFEYRGPRSVCRYIERLTEPGMTQALKGSGGICARVIENGTVRVGDEIEVLQPTEECPQSQWDPVSPTVVSEQDEGTA
jgi:MOSC domain-containing protein YiiM